MPTSRPASSATPHSAHTPVAEVDLAITGMTCAACVARVEKKLNKIEGVNAVVNLATERAHVELAEALPSHDLIAAVENAGYGARLVRRLDAGQLADDVDAAAAEEAAEAARTARVADLSRRLMVAGVLAVPVVLLSMVPGLEFPGWQWLVGALAAVIAFWCGWPFHRAAFRAARHGSTTMDTLVSLGVLASMGWSAWALFAGGAGRIGYTMPMRGAHATAEPHLYFESATLIVTFLLVGRLLEARTRRSAGQALRSLLSLGATEALRIRRADGTTCEELIPTEDLQVGDVFRTRPGEKVAADGIVIAGESALDASLLTGESAPVNVSPGSEVTGATLNTYAAIDVEARRVGEATTLASMGRLLAEAQSGKAPVQRVADRISAVFVPAVITIAVIVLVVRLVALHNPVEVALASAIAVLVVACPCALGLATPTALLVGSGRASERGILMRGPEVLELAHAVDTIVLDKTGTLTRGEMALVDMACADGMSEAEALALAAGVEAGSEHPVAGAVRRAARERGVAAVQASDYQAHPGGGVSARGSSGERLRVGSRAWVESEGVYVPPELADFTVRAGESGSTCVVVAREDQACAAFAVRDALREGAAEAVAQLRGLGVTPVLLTGDAREAAEAIARDAGIEDVRAGVMPGAKLAAIEELQAAGHTVAMAGDGINDAPALAGADLSLAMGSGTDAAKAASDMTIVNSSVGSIPTAIRLARRTLRIVHENLAWAFGYNLVAIPLAAAGIILPGLAAAAMAASSVIVVANSLRLKRA